MARVAAEPVALVETVAPGVVEVTAAVAAPGVVEVTAAAAAALRSEAHAGTAEAVAAPVAVVPVVVAAIWNISGW